MLQLLGCRVAQYQLFADDSGNREYDNDQDYVKSGKSRYFVYGSLLIGERDAGLLVARLRELKEVVFSTPNVEVKSNWLRMPGERQERYLDRYGISDATLTSFVDDYYRLIVQAPLTAFGAIVDKLHMQERYGSPWYAPTVAYEVLMQRVVLSVPRDSTVSVTMDDISGKTPRANEYGTLLAVHHDQLRRSGSKLQPRISFAPLAGPIRFTNSERSDLVQVADVIAYNLHRQFRDHGEAWERPPSGAGTLPLYPHFKKICGKFCQDKGGRIQGFGIVKFPLKNQIRWRVTKDAEEE
jgi:hypothetical protein